MDKIWSMDSSWGDTYEKRTDVPKMSEGYISIGRDSSSPVPDVKGMGLKDAIYAIENNGYRCQYEGTGHVVSQTPAAGKKYSKGETVKVILK